MGGGPLSDRLTRKFPSVADRSLRRAPSPASAGTRRRSPIGGGEGMDSAHRRQGRHRARPARPGRKRARRRDQHVRSGATPEALHAVRLATGGGSGVLLGCGEPVVRPATDALAKLEPGRTRADSIKQRTRTINRRVHPQTRPRLPGPRTLKALDQKPPPAAR